MDVVPLPQKPHAPTQEEQKNLPDMLANLEDAEFTDHVMDIVQQAQTMVENVQAQRNSIEEHNKVVA